MGGITDGLIAWKTCRLWLPCQMFGLDNNGTNTISLSQGTPTLEPASGTLEVTTIPMTTADEAHIFFPIPWNWDRKTKVLGRVFFIHASTDASDAPVWKLGVKFYGKQAQTVEAKGGADDDVSITSPATSATDDSLEVTAWTDLDWHDHVAATDVALALTVEFDALGSATADECEFLGVELAWEVDACEAVHRKQITDVEVTNPI